MKYYAAFDISAIGAGSIHIANSGHTTIAVNLANLRGTDANSASTALFFQYWLLGTWGCFGEDPAVTRRLTNYAVEPLLNQLTVALQAAATSASWATPSSLLALPGASYPQITYPTSITVTFDNIIGANLFGYTSTSAGSGTTVAATADPLYAITPTLTATSLHTLDYEPQAVANHAVPDNGGGGFGVSRNVAPLYRDWIQQFNIPSVTIRRQAATPHLWTFQDLFEHCRGEFPFIVTSGFGDTTPEVFFLRSEGTQWHPERASPANAAHYHVPFKTVVEGTVEQIGGP